MKVKKKRVIKVDTRSEVKHEEKREGKTLIK